MERPAAFVPFGADHLVALGLTAAAALALVKLVRRGPTASRMVRTGLVVVIAVGVAGFVALLHRYGALSWRALVPLHVCDLLLVVAVVALVTRARALAELLYYWAGAGTVLALVGPDVGRGWPDPWFVVFFGFHGVVVVAAAVLTFGERLAPRRGSSLRVFAWTLGYAGLVALVNAAWGTNYMYLSRKPRGATLLDALGPWPWYVVAGAAIALVAFVLLELPFRRASGRPAPLRSKQQT